jgi:hypothetical protein
LLLEEEVFSGLLLGFELLKVVIVEVFLHWGERELGLSTKLWVFGLGDGGWGIGAEERPLKLKVICQIWNFDSFGLSGRRRGRHIQLNPVIRLSLSAIDQIPLFSSHRADTLFSFHLTLLMTFIFLAIQFKTIIFEVDLSLLLIFGVALVKVKKMRV